MTTPVPIADEIVLSTVLLSWNRSDLLARTLASYLATVSVPSELIVVDNGSTDDSPRIIAAACADRPNHEAVLLTDNRAGEAINHGIERCRGRYIHVSENDIEYLPGWDRALLAKLTAFPKLGLISPFAPSQAPTRPWSRDGMTVLVAETNVVTTNVAPRQVYDAGVRWQSSVTGAVSLPADYRFSCAVRDAGYVVAWNDVSLVNHLGGSLAELVDRLPYYLASYAARPWVGVAALDRMLRRRHGHRLVQDDAGTWSVERLSNGTPRR